MTTTWREELSWAAGFFDGEGHIGFSRNKRHDLYLNMTQIDRAVLDRFQRAVGCGRVSDPFLRSYRNPNEHDIYAFQMARFEYVQATVAMLWEFLCPIKRTQAKNVLVAVRERPTHRRTCRHGHPRTPENSYFYKGRPLCKLCKKIQWSRYRALRKIKPMTLFGEGPA